MKEMEEREEIRVQIVLAVVCVCVCGVIHKVHVTKSPHYLDGSPQFSLLILYWDYGV